jgi:hypothetical protein
VYVYPVAGVLLLPCAVFLGPCFAFVGLASILKPDCNEFDVPTLWHQHEVVQLAYIESEATYSPIS